MENYDDEKDTELERDAKRATDETKDTLAEAGDKIKAGAKDCRKQNKRSR